MIVITGCIVMRPGQRAEAIALGVEHSVRSRGEPGCIAHNVHVDVEDESRLVFLELWTNREAVDAHFALPASRQFVRDLAAMGQGPSRMRVVEGIEVVELERTEPIAATDQG